MTDRQTNIIQIDKLKLGLHEFDFVLDDTYFQSIVPSEVLGGNVRVAAKLNVRESDYSLRLTIFGDVDVTCDRCLDPVSVAVDLDEEMDVEDEGETLDLDWLAYEQIVIHLPLVHSHQLGGCNPAMELLLQSHLCTEVEEPEI